MLPGGAESAMAVARECACGINRKVLFAISYFYTAKSKLVRRERRCKKVDGGGSRTKSGRERGGVLRAARGVGKEIVRQARVQGDLHSDNTKRKRKGDSKRRCGKDEKRTLRQTTTGSCFWAWSNCGVKE